MAQEAARRWVVAPPEEHHRWLGLQRSLEYRHRRDNNCWLMRMDALGGCGGRSARFTQSHQSLLISEPAAEYQRIFDLGCTAVLRMHVKRGGQLSIGSPWYW